MGKEEPKVKYEAPKATVVELETPPILLLESFCVVDFGDSENPGQGPGFWG